MKITREGVLGFFLWMPCVIVIVIITLQIINTGNQAKSIEITDLSEPMKDIVNTCPDSGVARITVHASREDSWLEVECVQKGPVATDGATEYSY